MRACCGSKREGDRREGEGEGEESAKWKAKSEKPEGERPISDFKLQTSEGEEELIPVDARVLRLEAGGRQATRDRGEGGANCQSARGPTCHMRSRQRASGIRRMRKAGRKLIPVDAREARGVENC